MRLRKPPQIPMRPILPLRAIVRCGAKSPVVPRVLPRLPRQRADGAVLGSEHGGVERGGVEAAGDGVDVAREAREDVDLALGAEDVAEDDVAGGAVAAVVFPVGGVGDGDLDAGGVVGVHGVLVVGRRLGGLRFAGWFVEEGEELGVGDEEEVGS